MEERIQELEIRYTLQQDTLLQLSDMIARHEKEIARLRSEIDELRGRVSDDPLPFAIDEKPPHY